MNKFTADMAKELSNFSRNNCSTVIDYIIYQSCLGYNYIIIERSSPLYNEAIEIQDDLRKDGYNVYVPTCSNNAIGEAIYIEWR